MINIKELPKIYKNKIDKQINNNRNVYYSSNEQMREKSDTNNKTTLQKINEIFASQNYIYKAAVEITLKDKVLKKRIIGRNKDYIITMDNDLILINDIIDIKSLKK